MSPARPQPAQWRRTGAWAQGREPGDQLRWGRRGVPRWAPRPSH